MTEEVPGASAATGTDSEDSGVGLTGRPPRNIPEPKPKPLHRPAKVIAMRNQKGGVGKTTSTINLGRAWPSSAVVFFLVDLDPQGALSGGLGCTAPPTGCHHPQRSRRAAGVDRRRDGAHQGRAPRPGAKQYDLSAAEIQLVNEEGREQTLGRALYPVLDRYDHVLIDCQPSTRPAHRQRARLRGTAW